MINLNIVGTDELVDKAIADANGILMEEEAAAKQEIFHSSLASHIKSIFQTNMDARRSSGIEEEMLSALRAYNGEYDPKDAAAIAKGGSRIYMNLTATKCRAATSWIRDILMGKEVPFAIEPTTLPALPTELAELIDASIRDEFENIKAAGTQDPSKVKAAQESIKELNQKARDIKEAIQEEIMAEARWQIKQMEQKIKDQLDEGKWTEALSDFIEDFCIFPSTFMKGPIVTKKKRLTWVNGEAVVTEDYVFLNKRVSPFDIYPSPNSTTIDDGDLIEHIRLTRGEIHSLIGTQGYNDEAIIKVLEECENGYTGDDLDSALESELEDEEKRGDSSAIKNDTIHGLHFHGQVSASMLQDWGLQDECLLLTDEQEMFEVEAILVGSQVIKCRINDDPLCRRPYYKASWQNRPGSFWGRSLPNLMSDIQRMCNATARALANNMGLASGPQIEVYVDRLADDGDISDIYPFKVWQLTSDPTGGTGRAIAFSQPSSNAAELLAVYKEFEIRADDATGIPRYAYGNERTGGAAQTASGLSMLLESASKSIKDAIRHIDDGLIRPRVEYQFYYNMLKDPLPSFSGDVQIIAKGSSALTVKGAEQMRRNEFLQITANPIDLEIIGKNGRASILREVAKDLNLSANIVPSRLELKKQDEKKEEMMKQQAQAEGQKGSHSVEATRLQIEGQMQMAAGAQEIQKQALILKQEKQDADAALTAQKLQLEKEKSIMNATSRLKATEMSLGQREVSGKRAAAVQLQQKLGGNE